MIDNPLKWYNTALKYAIPKQSDKDNNDIINYGDVFLIRDSAPEEVKKDFKKYNNLIKKVLYSWDFILFKGINEIVGFSDDMTEANRERSEIIIKLIKQGYLDFKLSLS